MKQVLIVEYVEVNYLEFRLFIVYKQFATVAVNLNKSGALRYFQYFANEL